GRAAGCREQLERLGGDARGGVAKAHVLQHLETALPSVCVPPEGSRLRQTPLVRRRAQRRKEILKSILDSRNAADAEQRLDRQVPQPGLRIDDPRVDLQALTLFHDDVDTLLQRKRVPRDSDRRCECALMREWDELGEVDPRRGGGSSSPFVRLVGGAAQAGGG